ncbi:hypothetical protein OO013_16380 [Mangrovivirga sp. M17]|uniref:Uncharacterized protein n=1 Tax=Mangrovivirga halotolerans TaxID=2993936 RepID=A0ABT3RV04_9BACT|nr:hypothetical protein [Mangrovivirga halotolerans]MCX2745458.1 hypothetical protein [Mangrovivirga halotolerans]
MNEIIKSIIATVLQTTIYILLFAMGWILGMVIHNPSSMTIAETVGFAAFIKFSIILFGTAMLIMNVVLKLLNRRWLHGIMILFTVSYILYWGQGISYTPYKTLLFLITGIVAIYSKIPIDRLLNKTV